MAKREVPAASIPEEDANIIVDEETGEVVGEVTDLTIASDSVGLANFLAGTKDVFMTCKMDTPEGKMYAHKMLAGGDIPLSKLINNTVSIKDFVIRMVRVKSRQTHHYSMQPRTSILLDDGRIATCTSSGIVNSLSMIMFIYGQPPYADAVKVSVEQVEKGSNRIYTLNPVM